MLVKRKVNWPVELAWKRRIREQKGRMFAADFWKLNRDWRRAKREG